MLVYQRVMGKPTIMNEMVLLVCLAGFMMMLILLNFNQKMVFNMDVLLCLLVVMLMEIIH